MVVVPSCYSSLGTIPFVKPNVDIFKDFTPQEFAEALSIYEFEGFKALKVFKL